MINKTEAITEIARRGGETEIDHMPYGRAGWKSVQTRELEVVDTDKGEGLLLLHAEGWRYYSRRFGSRPATLSYLVGLDDNGPWAVRVPGTIETVRGALQWITPKEVKEARSDWRCPQGHKDGGTYMFRGKFRSVPYCQRCKRRMVTPRVSRQGDVYAVERERSRDYAEQSAAKLDGHTWDPDTRTLYHDDTDRPHKPLHVPFPCKLVQQRVYRMGRGSGRSGGD